MKEDKESKKNTCDLEFCNQEPLGDDGKCILHCNKHGFLGNPKRKLLENEFGDALIYEIYRQVSENIKKKGNPYSLHKSFSLDEVKANFDVPATSPKVLEDIVREMEFDFLGIDFPNRSPDISVGYEYLSEGYARILNRLDSICFQGCSFDVGSLYIPTSSVRYHCCKFFQSWLVTTYKQQNKYEDPLFFSCEFFGDGKINEWGQINILTLISTS